MILACHNIEKAFGEREIVRDGSFHIEDREKAALVGVNGAGKSTILKMIIGEEPLDGGDVILAHVAESVRHGEHGLELVVGLVPGQEEVALVHLLEVELVEFVYVHLQSLVHFYYSLSHLMSLSVSVARNWVTSAVLFSSL